MNARNKECLSPGFHYSPVLRCFFITEDSTGLVISHLVSLNSESINLGSFVEQKYLFLLADKVLLLCQKAVLTGQSSRATRRLKPKAGILSTQMPKLALAVCKGSEAMGCVASARFMCTTQSAKRSTGEISKQQNRGGNPTIPPKNTT